MSSLSLRPARPEDTDALSDCFAAAYAPFKATIPDLPDVTAGLDQDILNNFVLVALDKDELVGGAVLVLRAEAAHLANIAVHPRHNGKGVGGALIRALEREARAQNRHFLDLATHVQMQQNVKLYEHLGWKILEKTGNKVLMRKAF